MAFFKKKEEQQPDMGGQDYGNDQGYQGYTQDYGQYPPQDYGQQYPPQRPTLILLQDKRQEDHNEGQTHVGDLVRCRPLNQVLGVGQLIENHGNGHNGQGQRHNIFRGGFR